MDSLGKNLIVIGLVIAGLGVVLWFLGRAGMNGLPGDIVVERKNVKVFFPIVSCLVASVILSLILWLFRR